MNHDQNFKNLVLDYPREALAFFAAAEAGHIDADARVTPVRQEQLGERLGERFRELDIPLLVEWPDRRREVILFVLEEETGTGLGQGSESTRSARAPASGKSAPLAALTPTPVPALRVVDDSL
jgi:hypothetical protein